MGLKFFFYFSVTSIKNTIRNHLPKLHKFFFCGNNKVLTQGAFKKVGLQIVSILLSKKTNQLQNFQIMLQTIRFSTKDIVN